MRKHNLVSYLNGGNPTGSISLTVLLVVTLLFAGDPLLLFTVLLSIPNILLILALLLLFVAFLLVGEEASCESTVAACTSHIIIAGILSTLE